MTAGKVHSWYPIGTILADIDTSINKDLIKLCTVNSVDN